VAIAVFAGSRLIASDDILFNLAHGRWIIRNGFPLEDPFSFTARRAWFPHEWGFGVLVYFSERLLGGGGPVWLCALLLAGATAGCWKLILGRPSRPLLELLLLVLVLSAQSWMWSEQRAYLVSLALLPLWLLLLKKSPADGPRRLWLFPPLALVWSNLHGGWPLGILFLGSYTVSLIKEKRPPATCLAAAAGTAACLMAAAVSPAGWANLIYPFRFLLSHGGAGIWEWSALDLREGASCSLVLLGLTWLWSLFKARRFDAAFDLPAALLMAASLFASRHGPFAAMVLAAAVRRKVEQLTPEECRRPEKPTLLDRFVRGGGELWPAAALLIIASVAGINPKPLAERLDTLWFPVKSLQELCRRPPGRVLNRYHLGGAVQALCGPEMKVFIDGRNDCFPLEVHRQYEQLVLLQEGWRETLGEVGPDYILWSPLNRGRLMERELRRLENCRLLQEEESGQLFACDWSRPSAGLAPSPSSR